VFDYCSGCRYGFFSDKSVSLLGLEAAWHLHGGAALPCDPESMPNWVASEGGSYHLPTVPCPLQLLFK